MGMGEATLVLGRPHAFERGDKLYLTTPVTLAKPTDGQIEEFAFSTAVKSMAPNDNIGWLQGRYVESGKPNLNKAMWLTDELGLKSLTPMLMPITVMHDPRTSVGVIADTKLDESGSVIENALAVWKHRYPEIWEEAEHNVERGSMAQSMECYSPWYTCSSCDQQYVKLPQGAEQASWCDHLRTNSGWRILRDVCFTGTGLIFGSRGGQPAYSEATLDYLHDEIAEAHDRSHHDSTYRPSQRSASTMGLVQIEESELAALRAERDAAKAKVDEQAEAARALTTKVEQAEAAKVAAETAKAAAETKVTEAETAASAATLKSKRIDALGTGFMAKLGDTSKSVLNELAAKVSDEDWERAVAEREELAGVKRDATAEAAPGGGTPPGTPPPAATGPTFADDEVASFMRSGGGAAPAVPVNGATAVRSLARSFAKKSAPAPAGK